MDDGYIGIVYGIQQIFQDFRSAWYLGCTTLCYLVIQLLRGKAGFQVPWVTKKLDAMSKEAKTLAILAAFLLIGLFGVFAKGKVDFATIMDGVLGGLAIGVGTIGTRNAFKQGIDELKQLKNGKATNDEQDKPS